MSQYVPIAPKTTQGKSWTTPVDLSTFAQHPLLPLSLAEVGTAAGALPLVLVRTKESWLVMAVCSKTDGHNLFIRDGKWLGNYIPEICRLYPFDVVAIGSKAVVLFDQDSGLMREDSEGKPFFGEDEKPAGEFAGLMNALMRRAALNTELQTLANQLSDTKVLMPWPESLRKNTGVELQGLYMVNEKALSELDNETFLKLRKALPLIYSLNLSVQQCHLLQRLEKINPAPVDGSVEVETLFGGSDDTLKFNF